MYHSESCADIGSDASYTVISKQETCLPNQEQWEERELLNRKENVFSNCSKGSSNNGEVKTVRELAFKLKLALISTAFSCAQYRLMC